MYVIKNKFVLTVSKNCCRCFRMQQDLLRLSGEDLRSGIAQAEGGQNPLHLPLDFYGGRRRIRRFNSGNNKHS